MHALQTLIQPLIVGLIVAAALLTVLRRYLPLALRQQIVYRINTAAQSVGITVNTSRVMLGTQTASCADGCSTCGACATPVRGSATQPTKPGEPSVSVIRLDGLRRNAVSSDAK